MRDLDGGAVDHPRTDPDHVEFLMPRGGESFVWTARSQPTASFIGWFSLFPQSDTVAEIGFRLCRRQWGCGLATEGAALLLAWGFEKGGYRGWLSGTYLGAVHVRVPIITYDPVVYERYYVGQPYYNPRAAARRDARIEYRVHRRMDRRWERWTD